VSAKAFYSHAEKEGRSNPSPFDHVDEHASKVSSFDFCVGGIKGA